MIYGVKDLQEAKYIMADCGHEVYVGEAVYRTHRGYACEECARDILKHIKIEDIAEMLGWGKITIGNEE